MTNKPVIFISAVSAELKAARDLVAKTFESFGIGVEFQDSFGAPSGDLRDILRDKIDGCHGLIQIVGQQYGCEPPQHDDPLDPCSYTQLEVRYALQRKFKPWLLLLDENFPQETAGADDKDKATLQQAWRVRVRRLGHLYEKIADVKDIKILVQQIAHEINKTLGPAASSDDATAQRLAKIEQALAQLAQAMAEAALVAPQEDPAAIEARAYETLEKKLGLKQGSLAVELPRLAEKLLREPDTALLARAQALFVKKRFADAETQALLAKDNTLAGVGSPLQDAIRALELAGNAAEQQIKYDRALEHYRAAAVLTDRTRDPVEWASAQWDIAVSLSHNGQNREAEQVWRDVIEVCMLKFGPENSETLGARGNLAIALCAQGKYFEAEQENRAVLEIERRTLGFDHPSTLSGLHNLANALSDQGKHAEAEQVHRSVLGVRQRILGMDHRDTLASRNCLANTLYHLGKYQEAEREHRARIAIEQRVLGAEHPDTLSSRNNLANALSGQGKYVEAEQELRQVLAIKEHVLGPDHPDTLVSRMNLGHTLRNQRKYVEAEQAHRVNVALLKRVLGSEHPTTLNNGVSLALALNSQAKHLEAESEYRKALASMLRVLDDEHPDVCLCCYNLALCLEDQGKLKEALEFAERAGKGMKRAVGPMHPHFKLMQEAHERIEAELEKQQAADGGKK